MPTADPCRRTLSSGWGQECRYDGSSLCATPWQACCTTCRDMDFLSHLHAGGNGDALKLVSKADGCTYVVPAPAEQTQ